MAVAVASLLLPSSVTADHVRDGVSWACGFGGGGRDGHPDDCGIDPVGGGADVESVAEPTWGDAWIDGDERVLGVEVQGDARAVPVKMLDRHEILNDVIGGVPVAVTYCPLCGSGLTFEREVTIGGQTQTLTFAPSGFLYQHDLVMWDPQTGTLWNQILGTPIGTLRDGHADRDHHDVQLETVPTALATWDAWRQEHPDSTMLQAVPGYSYGSAYAGYDGSCQLGISAKRTCDLDGLHPKEQVVGVDPPRGPVAFPRFAVIGDGGVAFHEDTGVVVAVSDGGLVDAYDAGPHDFNWTDGRWLDQDGHAWDLRNGTRADGGTDLEPLEPTTMYWFAWKEHHPDTALWLPGDAEGAKVLEDDGRLPGFTIGIVVTFFVALAWIWRRRR